MLTSRSQKTEGVKPNCHDIINQITRIDGGLGTLYTSHYKIGYYIPAIVKNGRPQRNLYITHCKNGYIKIHSNIHKRPP